MLRAPWLGAPRSTPALRRAAFDSTLASQLAVTRADRSVRAPASHPLRRAVRELAVVEGQERSAGGTRSVCRPSMRTCRWTARPAWRSAPTGCARSDAARPSRSIPAPGAAGRFGPQARQPGQHPLHRHPRPPHPRQRGLRHRAGIHRQQRHPGLLRGPGGRDRPPGGRRHGHLPAALLPLHHRGGAGQQLRRQRHLRFRADRAPDPRRHSEGKRRRRADVHRSARPRARPRTGRSGTSTSRAGASSGSWIPTACPAIRPWTSSGSIPRPSPPPTGPPRSGSTAIAPPGANSGVNPNLGGITASRRPRRHSVAPASGALGAADPGHRLLPRCVRALDRPGDQAGPERLSGRQLPDRRRRDGRHLPGGGSTEPPRPTCWS